MENSIFYCQDSAHAIGYAMFAFCSSNCGIRSKRRARCCIGLTSKMMKRDKIFWIKFQVHGICHYGDWVSRWPIFFLSTILYSMRESGFASNNHFLKECRQCKMQEKTAHIVLYIYRIDMSSSYLVHHGAELLCCINDGMMVAKEKH
jgi:hypothetical protein